MHKHQMATGKMTTYFVSEKISKIRWISEEFKESENFLTGSWDMGRANYVRIWKLKKNNYTDEHQEVLPHCSDKVAFNGDITGLEFITTDIVAASCTNGYVSLMKIQRGVEENKLEERARSSLLHYFSTITNPAPCTGLSIYGKEMATVGEDGRLNVIDVVSLKLHRTIEASSVALTAVAFVNTQEVLAANRMGLINVFDIRNSDDKKPTTSLLTASSDEKLSNFVSCLTIHPTQNHVVFAGSEEGSITIWDLRQPSYPASYLTAHTSAITEIGFHRSDATRLFTAAEDGELWMWTQIMDMKQISHDILKNAICDNVNPWLNGERTKNRISVTSLISNLRKSMNSFDSNASKVICGGDCEAIYYIESL